jgi:NAD-dependent histone deacetylase SIR2
MGWDEELEALWEETNPDLKSREAEDVPPQTRDERLQDEVDRLTEEVERSLTLTSAYEKRVRERLEDLNSTESDGLAHVFPHLAHKSR